MVQINAELCTGCKTCISDCPGGIIAFEEGKAVVHGNCLKCGHCVACCPVNAVTIPEYDMEDVEEYNPDTFCIAPENMLHAIKFRRSIRNFRPDKIEEAAVAHILDAGRYTATARNLQKTTFVFVQDRIEEFRSLVWGVMPELLPLIKKEVPRYGLIFERFYEKWCENPKDDTLLYNTPAVLVIATDNIWDGGLAAANMENMAVSEGAGVLYSGYMARIIGASPRLKEWLQIEKKEVACCMLLGYPAVTYERTAPRRAADIVRL